MTNKQTIKEKVLEDYYEKTEPKYPPDDRLWVKCKLCNDFKTMIDGEEFGEMRFQSIKMHLIKKHGISFGKSEVRLETKQCVVCGNDFQVWIKPNGTYDSNVFFSKELSESLAKGKQEYWECQRCVIKSELKEETSKQYENKIKELQKEIERLKGLLEMSDLSDKIKEKAWKRS